MRIELELPDWADERAIYVMAGIELVAYKFPTEKWHVKVGRCNQCGKCCQTLNRHFFPTVENTCVYLVRESKDTYVCKLAIHRPFGCCVGVSTKIPECTEKYEELE